jgi:hypothetical protein
MKLLATIEVEAPDGSDPSEVAGALNKMIEVGYADASDTVDDDEIDDGGEAEFVTNLTIGQPTVFDPAAGLLAMFAIYNITRKAAGFSAPNTTIWWAEDMDRNYEAIADGLGGARACIWEGNPCDCIQHYSEQFATEDEATSAIMKRAIEAGAFEADGSEDDSLPGDIIEPVEFNADELHRNVDAGRYTHFEHLQGVAQLKDDLVKVFGEAYDWGVSRLINPTRESVGKEWFHDVINSAHKLVSLRADDALALPQYHLCGNCSAAWTDEQLVLPMQDLDQRLDPGSEVPSGDCPGCGAFCYICEKPTP